MLLLLLLLLGLLVHLLVLHHMEMDHKRFKIGRKTPQCSWLIPFLITWYHLLCTTTTHGERKFSNGSNSSKPTYEPYGYWNTNGAK